jgi:hypothetical protein
VKVLQSSASEPQNDKNVITDNYFEVMLASYKDTLQIQEKLGHNDQQNNDQHLLVYCQV